MKRNIIKSSPTPGRLEDLTVTINSLVDTPANGQKFLITKGIKKIMNEELKKKLIDGGFDPELFQTKEGVSEDQISKAIDFISEIAPDTEEAKKSLLNSIKKAFYKKDPLEPIKKDIAEIKEAISKMSSPEDSENPQAETPASNDISISEEVAKLEAEKKELLSKENEEIQKKYQDLKKEVEILKTKQGSGNASFVEGNEAKTPEEIQKQKQNDRWAGTALSF